MSSTASSTSSMKNQSCEQRRSENREVKMFEKCYLGRHKFRRGGKMKVFQINKKIFLKKNIGEAVNLNRKKIMFANNRVAICI